VNFGLNENPTKTVIYQTPSQPHQTAAQIEPTAVETAPQTVTTTQMPVAEIAPSTNPPETIVMTANVQIQTTTIVEKTEAETEVQPETEAQTGTETETETETETGTGAETKTMPAGTRPAETTTLLPAATAVGMIDAATMTIQTLVTARCVVRCKRGLFHVHKVDDCLLNC